MAAMQGALFIFLVFQGTFSLRQTRPSSGPLGHLLPKGGRLSVSKNIGFAI